MWDCTRAGHLVGDEVTCFQCGERVVTDEQVAAATVRLSDRRSDFLALVRRLDRPLSNG